MDVNKFKKKVEEFHFIKILQVGCKNYCVSGVRYFWCLVTRQFLQIQGHSQNFFEGEVEFFLNGWKILWREGGVKMFFLKKVSPWLI